MSSPAYTLNGGRISEDDLARLIDASSVEQAFEIGKLEPDEKLIFGTPWLILVLERIS